MSFWESFNPFSAIGDLIGGQLDREATEDANVANARLQKEFAQQGIRWRVEDAKAAGIHPLFALGAQVAPASPSYVPETTGSGFRSLGQNIGRAMEAKVTQTERLQNRLLEAQIKGQEIENAYRASNLRLVTQPGQPPSLPSSGTVTVPREIIAHSGDTEKGLAAGNRKVLYKGREVTIPSSDFQQSMEVEGPAGYWYQMMNTMPDLIWADVYDKIKKYGNPMTRARRFYQFLKE